MSSELEKIRKWVYDCVRCSNCKWLPEEAGHEKSCPAGSKFKFESYYGSGKVWMGRALLEGTLDFSDSVAKKLYACPTCGNCMNICENQLSEHLVDIFETLRAAAVLAGVGPLEAHKAFAALILAHKNPYGEPHEERTKWVPIADFDRVAEIAYFVGCTAAYRRQEIAKSTFNLFQKLGEKVAITNDEYCCGSPLIRTGQLKQVSDLVVHNLKVLNDMGIKTLVTACAGCYKTIKVDWPKYNEVNFEVLHITEFLWKKIEEEKLKFEKESKEKVTYHDPCHLGRHSKIYEAPRKLIQSVPGVELIEMPRNQENAWCCGAGGGVKAEFKDWAVEISKERIEEAEATGASKLITSCPFCVTNLRDAVNESGSTLKVYDLTEYLLEKM